MVVLYDSSAQVEGLERDLAASEQGALRMQQELTAALMGNANTDERIFNLEQSVTDEALGCKFRVPCSQDRRDPRVHDCGYFPARLAVFLSLHKATSAASTL